MDELKKELTKSRQQWVSLLKGIAILLVVVGHVATPLTKNIYSFHVPLFFFVSGFFVLGRNRSIWQGTLKDFSRLIVPFIIFGAIALVIEYIKRAFFPNYSFITSSINLVSELKGTFFWMDMASMHHYGFVLWFLPALFWGKFLTRLLVRYIQLPFLTLIIATGFLLGAARLNWNLPFGFDKGLIATWWVLLGYYAYPLLTKLSFRSLIIGLIVTTLLLLVFPVPYLNIATRYFEFAPYNLLYSLIPILLFVCISRLTASWPLMRPFVYWGEETLTIFVSHPYTNNIGVIIAGFLPQPHWFGAVAISIILINLILVGLRKFEPSIKTWRTGIVPKNASV